MRSTIESMPTSGRPRLAGVGMALALASAMSPQGEGGSNEPDTEGDGPSEAVVQTLAAALVEPAGWQAEADPTPPASEAADLMAVLLCRDLSDSWPALLGMQDGYGQESAALVLDIRLGKGDASKVQVLPFGSLKPYWVSLAPRPGSSEDDKEKRPHFGATLRVRALAEALRNAPAITAAVRDQIEAAGSLQPELWSKYRVSPKISFDTYARVRDARVLAPRYVRTGRQSLLEGARTLARHATKLAKEGALAASFPPSPRVGTEPGSSASTGPPAYLGAPVERLLAEHGW